MRALRAGLAAALAMALGPAHAVDLLQVYRDSLTSDPVYQSARAQYQSSIEALPQARAGYLPVLTGQASAFRNDVQFESVPSLAYNTTTYAVTLSQPVFRLQNWIAIGEAKQQVVQAEAALASAGSDLIVRVAQAYFDVL
ncbi:MAG TPA: TolC family protein, partial [Usitatibacter sp.]|nr:TolC family protein [Usitatibacter sp.]